MNTPQLIPQDLSFIHQSLLLAYDHGNTIARPLTLVVT